MIAGLDFNVIVALTNVLLTQIDLNAVVARLDVNQIAGQLDVNALIEKVDIDAIVQRTQLEAIVTRASAGWPVRASTWSAAPASDSTASSTAG